MRSLVWEVAEWLGLDTRGQRSAQGVMGAIYSYLQNKAIVDKQWLRMILQHCKTAEATLHRFEQRHAELARQESVDDAGLTLENVITYIEDKLA